MTSSISRPSFSIPIPGAFLGLTRSAIHVSKPMLWVNSLQNIPVELNILKTFFHSSSSGYSSVTLPVVRWLFLLQWGRALYLSYSLSSMVLWYSSMPNAPGKNGTWEVEEVEYYFEESSAAEWLRKQGNGDGVVGVSLDPPAPLLSIWTRLRWWTVSTVKYKWSNKTYALFHLIVVYLNITSVVVLSSLRTSPVGWT